MREGQGKSSIAPLFQSGAMINLFNVAQCDIQLVKPKYLYNLSEIEAALSETV